MNYLDQIVESPVVDVDVAFNIDTVVGELLPVVIFIDDFVAQIILFVLSLFLDVHNI
jgi:hypothetical protein